MSTTSRSHSTDTDLTWRAIRWGFIGIFGGGALVNASLAVWSPATYRPFADAPLFGWVSDGWRNIFMANPTLWALLLGAGELMITMLLVSRPRVGYLGVVGFHLALMLFGWGFWLWCVPMLAFAVPATIHAFRTR
jgi:hypothetical protein